jgi:uncharacterized protein (TIGR00661 family)
LTNIEKNNKKTGKLRILVAPLDWGLGHATRCIPLIKLLVKRNAEVMVACEGHIASLLVKEFPEIVILPLKGYQITYSSGQKNFLLKLLTQIPRIIKTIKYEHKWLDKIIYSHQIDGVITDNRFGLYSKKVPCVFITHQLCIQTGNSWLNGIAQKINYRYINRFTACWVPDLEGEKNIAGKLSHPKYLPKIPVQYLGILSRCEKGDFKKDIDLLIMISGPEPQRSIFEKMLLAQLENIKQSIVFLRGLPEENSILTSNNNQVKIINHLPAKEINELIQKAELVLARCGYSTIMDLIALKQKAILIPTPGQTEQEYLAKYLQEKQLFYTVDQENFSLQKEVEQFKKSRLNENNLRTSMNETVVQEWLSMIKYTV